MAIGIFLACYVSWLHQDWSGMEFRCAVCLAPPEDEQVMIETFRGP
jgi:hypothetical protein